MPGAGRLGDKAQTQQDGHGCPACPHPGIGPAIAGSSDVLINRRPALRVDDVGIHAVCCGPNMWSAQQGSATVFINGKAAFRRNDPTRHCGGSGKLIEGSENVIIGDGSGGGGGGGGRGGSQADGGTANSTTSSATTRQLAAAPWARDAVKRQPTAAAIQPQAPAEAPLKTAWIEIALVDEDGAPVPGEEYRIALPDGSIRNGRLDDNGKARVLAIDPGTCVVTFPYLDAASWHEA